jgi:hypothetical protein
MRKSSDQKELELVQLFRQQGLQSWANDKETQNGGVGWLADTEFMDHVRIAQYFSQVYNFGVFPFSV